MFRFFFFENAVFFRFLQHVSNCQSVSNFCGVFSSSVRDRVLHFFLHGSTLLLFTRACFFFFADYIGQFSTSIAALRVSFVVLSSFGFSLDNFSRCSFEVSARHFLTAALLAFISFGCKICLLRQKVPVCVCVSQVGGRGQDTMLPANAHVGGRECELQYFPQLRVGVRGKRVQNGHCEGLSWRR